MTDRVGQYLGNYRLVHLRGRGSFADVYLGKHLHNFPAQVTPLIGREQEVATAVDLLRRPEVRELTLTGTGGIGKTRLGLQVAGELLDTFADGVYFVPLAPISEPALVVGTIAQTLGIIETGEQSLLDLLKHYLQDKHALLLLDNFEQVTAAATVLAELLAACPYLKLLVTSRAMLRVRGEHEFPVPPLALPDLAQLPGSEALLQYPAIMLFLDRALAIKPDFAVTEANARVIAEICTRLDGLPLAIELAAVRVKLLPPHSLLQRLEHRLQILTGGALDLPERQQTLRNTIAWSYYLLDDQEQRLFRRLCIFVGGFTLEAIEATCGAFGDEDGAVAILNQVASLMDKSLLQQSEQDSGGGEGGEGGEEPRFVMLETIREYGLEALGESNEVERMQQAHTAYYLSLAERAEPELGGPQQALWLGRLERDHDNLRVAMRWLMGDEREGKGRVMALRLGGALRRFWIVHSHISEGRNFLDSALAASEGVKELDAAVRAKALITAANLAVIQSDYQRAEVLATESLELFRELGDQSGVALSLYLLGSSAWTQGNSEATRILTEEALTISRALGDTDRVAWSLYTLGMWHSSRGEFTRARELFEESLVMHRELGSKRGMASSLTELAQLHFVSQGDTDMATIHDLVEEGQTLFRELGFKEGIADSLGLAGKIALKEGEVDTARQLVDESMKLYKEVGFRWGMVSSLCLLAKVAVRQGDRAVARKLYQESLALASEVGRRELIATSLEGLASIIAADGEPAWAAQLWGAAGSLRTAIGVSVAPLELAEYEQAMAAAREQLGEKIFEAHWVEGREMTPEQAMAAQGVGAVSSTVAEVTSAPVYAAGLTAREVEVLRLVVRGMTNMQIAHELVLSEKTVATHLSHIFNKTNSENRAGAVAFAIRQGLA